MKKFLSGLGATTLAISFAAATIAPANAAPMFAPKTETAATDIQQIQLDRLLQRRGDFNDDNDRRGNRNLRLERRGDSYYYNGHRGYSDQRRGYRQFEGFWFPPAAFLR